MKDFVYELTEENIKILEKRMSSVSVHRGENVLHINKNGNAQVRLGYLIKKLSEIKSIHGADAYINFNISQRTYWDENELENVNEDYVSGIYAMVPLDGPGINVEESLKIAKQYLDNIETDKLKCMVLEDFLNDTKDIPEEVVGLTKKRIVDLKHTISHNKRRFKEVIVGETEASRVNERRYR